jgi:hypothetical protein
MKAKAPQKPSTKSLNKKPSTKASTKSLQQKAFNKIAVDAKDAENISAAPASSAFKSFSWSSCELE